MGHLKNGILRAYCDRELSEKIRSRAEKHLAGCAACREKLRIVRADVDEVRSELDLLAPDHVPAPAPFAARVLPQGKNSGPFFRRFVFAPVRVPAILLILMASVVMVLSGMLYTEKRRQDERRVLSGVKPRQEYLTINSPNGIEIIPLNFSLEKFRFIENPKIMVIKEMMP